MSALRVSPPTPGIVWPGAPLLHRKLHKSGKATARLGALSEESTKVLCEMVGVVDAASLGNQVGHLTADEMVAVDDALELVLDLA